MSRCKTCGDHGIVLYAYLPSKDYDALACMCLKGQYWRQKWQLRAWADQQVPKPVHIGRLEEYLTPAELATFRADDGPAIAAMLDKVSA
jgi:hypothetical protein